TYTHPMLTKSNSQTEHRQEIEKAHQTISDVTGHPPTTFRAPFFDFNEVTVSICEDHKYKMVGAVNGEALDWEMPGVDHIITKTRDSLSNGSISLFHDRFDD
ncbi:polysaccharide deacetylase family protein, partial [Pseudomonas sp. 2822-17]|uniref:polysaccharide deacetylase family protein n=1 Tax=Pseudomonas sp. 2822-17 TaxID=1712678 RepID=UPI00117B9386